MAKTDLLQLPFLGLHPLQKWNVFWRVSYKHNKEIYFLSSSTFRLRLSPLKQCKNHRGPEAFQRVTHPRTTKHEKIPSPKCFCTASEKTSGTFGALQLTASKTRVTVDEVSLTEQKDLIVFSLLGLFIYFKDATLWVVPFPHYASERARKGVRNSASVLPGVMCHS